MGSKDFAAGLEFVLQMEQLANFPFISSNITDESGNLLFEPYVVLDRSSFSFGVTGATVSLPDELKTVGLADVETSVNNILADSDLGVVSNTNGSFTLIIPDSLRMREVVFTYMGYRRQTIPSTEIKRQTVIRLEPTVIPMQQVGVIGTERSLEIQKDIPQPISVIESKAFELRGYTDAGDLLRTDHTIQLNENISGKKTVNIRGGNADEVAILYNGVRMNSEFDNIFDIALVDLQNIDHLEVIRGSNSVLYGTEAFSGIINIVPKLSFFH